MTEAQSIEATPARTPKRGRPKGSRNRVTREIKDIALKYGPRAMREVARIALAKPVDGESAQEKALRVRCMEILFDRGWGKPVATTELTGKDGAALFGQTLDWLRGIPAPPDVAVTH